MSNDEDLESSAPNITTETSSIDVVRPDAQQQQQQQQQAKRSRRVVDQSCAVCMEVYEDCDVVCELRCQHFFHEQCASQWLAVGDSYFILSLNFYILILSWLNNMLL